MLAQRADHRPRRAHRRHRPLDAVAPGRRGAHRADRDGGGRAGQGREQVALEAHVVGDRQQVPHGGAAGEGHRVDPALDRGLDQALGGRGRPRATATGTRGPRSRRPPPPAARRPPRGTRRRRAGRRSGCRRRRRRTSGRAARRASRTAPASRRGGRRRGRRPRPSAPGRARSLPAGPRPGGRPARGSRPRTATLASPIAVFATRMSGGSATSRSVTASSSGSETSGRVRIVGPCTTEIPRTRAAVRPARPSGDLRLCRRRTHPARRRGHGPPWHGPVSTLFPAACHPVDRWPLTAGGGARRSLDPDRALLVVRLAADRVELVGGQAVGARSS